MVARVLFPVLTYRGTRSYPHTGRPSRPSPPLLPLIYLGWEGAGGGSPATTATTLLAQPGGFSQQSARIARAHPTPITLQTLSYQKSQSHHSVPKKPTRERTSLAPTESWGHI